VVVVVNYRTPERVSALLETLARAIPRPMGVIVVDNDSGDGSVAKIQATIVRRDLSAWVHVTCLPRNVGFAGGNNAGIAHALGTWPRARLLFLLNPDTLIAPDTISTLEALFERLPRMGIGGSQIRDPSGGLACSGHIGEGPIWQLASAARFGLLDRMVRSRFQRLVGCPGPLRCEWVSGAALMIRRETLDEIGLMDDRFFLYFEEIDLCRRARRAGWEVWLAPASRVTHFEGASTGIRRGRLPRYWFDSRRWFFLKHIGLPGLIAADAGWALGRSLRILADLLLWRNAGQGPLRMARDLLLGDLGAVLRGDYRGRQL
jgi:hypothetical protein